jgi:hypothetical protein
MYFAGLIGQYIEKDLSASIVSGTLQMYKDVKLDQIGRKSGKVEGSFVFNTETNEIKFVNPVRKVWGEHKSETAPIIKGTIKLPKPPIKIGITMKKIISKA